MAAPRGLLSALVFLLFLSAVGAAAVSAGGGAGPRVSDVAGRDCLACHVSVSASPGGGLVAGPLRGPVSPGAFAAAEAVLLGLGLAMAYVGLLRVRAVLADAPRRGRMRPSLSSLLRYAALQARVLRDPLGAAAHLPVYVGGGLLLLAGLVYLADPGAAASPLAGSSTVYTVFRVLSNAGAALMLLGLLVAWLRRVALPRPGMETLAEDELVLGVLGGLVATGMLVDAATAAAHYGAQQPWWDLSALLFARLWLGLSAAGFPAAFQAANLVHLAAVAATAALLGATKLRHILVSAASTALPRPDPEAAAEPVPDAEERIEQGGYIGAVRAADTSLRQRLDYEACVRCARCTAACPAYAAGRPLSPMHLIQAMRRALEEKPGEDLVPAVISPDTVWSCTTCGACLHECPVLVHHVETMHELRRGLVSKGENVPEELLQVSYSLMRTGNPYGSDPMEKEQWIQGLAEKGLVEIAEPGKEYDLLLWVGCAPAYDPRLRGTVEALLRLLKRAGLSVAVAPEQQCCGEPARRIGDELMFQELVRMNKEALEGIRFKRILVTCPHGLHVLRHEYPQYGVKWEVVHHSQLLAELLRQGRLPRPQKPLPITATYHDPCYLGRWNQVYEPPREVVGAAVAELREMPRNRDRSYCCGGGGGGVFYDPKKGERLSKIRIREAKGTGAKVVAVACPFCNIMLSAEAPDEGLEVRDIAELLDQALEGEGA